MMMLLLVMMMMTMMMMMMMIDHHDESWLLICQALGYDAILYLPTLTQSYSWQQLCAKAKDVLETIDVDPNDLLLGLRN